MRVFVTGATGFVGSAIVNELLKAGHAVTGLVRNKQSGEALIHAGVVAHEGNLDDPESIAAGIKDCDAVIHTAFNHDFSRFKENCETDRKVITALGEALGDSTRPLVITSGVGLMSYGRLLTEKDKPGSSATTPRAASEEAALSMAAKGVKAYIVRLPPTVHGKGDHGFVPMVAAMAKDKKQSVYVGDGSNQWPAVHRLDAAVLYRLIIEQQPAQTVYHAVAEEGIEFRKIATAIGNGFEVPVVSKTGKEAEDHFGWFMHFASLDCRASGEKTQNTLNWHPVQAGLLDDLVPGTYF